MGAVIAIDLLAVVVTYSALILQARKGKLSIWLVLSSFLIWAVLYIAIVEGLRQ